MAVPWITVLQLVPWKEVIKNAPAVLDGARKLWETAGRKSPGKTPSVVPAASAPLSAEARIATLEASVAGLSEQVLQSSTLIKELAEQNANLIQRAEMNRVLVVRLGYALGVVAAVATGAIVVAVGA